MSDSEPQREGKGDFKNPLVTVYFPTGKIPSVAGYCEGERKRGGRKREREGEKG